MFDFLAVSVVFTAVFAVTGGYALLRWASLRAAVAGRAGDEVAELSHLVMSLSMIAMTWGYSTSTGDVAQLVLFGVLGAYFLIQMTTDRLAISACACPAPGFHLLMCAAMGWMVVAMPWLMDGGATGDSASMQMDGMTMPMPEHIHDAHGGVPGFTVPLTLVIAVALVGAAGYWVHRLIRLRHAATESATESATPEPPAASASDTGTVTVTTHVAQDSRRPSAHRLLALLTPRVDAICHLLMSLGMAAMLLLML